MCGKEQTIGAQACGGGKGHTWAERGGVWAMGAVTKALKAVEVAGGVKSKSPQVPRGGLRIGTERAVLQLVRGGPSPQWCRLISWEEGFSEA